MHKHKQRGNKEGGLKHLTLTMEVSFQGAASRKNSLIYWTADRRFFDASRDSFVWRARFPLFLHQPFVTSCFSHPHSSHQKLQMFMKYEKKRTSHSTSTSLPLKIHTVKWDNSTGAIKICSLIMNELCVGVISAANTMALCTICASVYKLVPV